MDKGGSKTTVTQNEYSPQQQRLWDYALGGLQGFSRSSPFSQMTDPEQWFTGRQEWMGKYGHDTWRQRMEQGLKGMTDANSGYLSKIVSPALTNKMTAMGMGRSGAIGENLAMAAVPMAQQEAQARLMFEQASPQMEQMFNMLGLQAGGRQREMSQQDFLRQQQLVTSALGGMNTGPIGAMQQGSGMSPLWSLAALGLLSSNKDTFSGLGGMLSGAGGWLSGLFGGGAGGMGSLAGAGAMQSPWGTTFPT